MMGLAVTDATLNGESVCLRCHDGEIAEIGPGVAPADGDDVIDGSGLALVPGLVNAHTHAAMTLFRGFADDLPLMEWLEKHIWPAEARLESDDVYWGARLACIEMIRTGTVAFWDMYWHPEAVGRAAEDAGLRAVVTAPLIDGDKPERARELSQEAFERVAESATGRIQAGYAPHAPYTVGPESLRWVAERAEEAGATIQIHLSETRGEVEDCLAKNGMKPAMHLDATGLLGPRTVLAHGVWLDEEELELIAERGATVVTNPVANLKLAVGGVFPYPLARRLGVAMGIGTDGPGSNNSLDLLSDLKTFALLQKNAAADPAIVDASEALRLGRGGLSDLLRSPSLETGAPADFLLVDSRSPELSMGEIDPALVYAASGSVVDTTVVDGVALMRGGEIPGAGEVIAKAQACASRIGVR